MIIWKGWGVLALLIPLVCSWGANFIFDSMLGDGNYQKSTLAMPLIIGLSSIIVGIIGYKINNKLDRILIDPITNETFVLKQNHSFFWIPLQYWSIVIFLLSAALYASNAGIFSK